MHMSHPQSTPVPHGTTHTHSASFTPMLNNVTNQSMLYFPPAQPGSSAYTYTSTPYQGLAGQQGFQATAASPTAVMYGHNTNNQAGMSFNIMGANKPKKLEQLTHPNIKKFKSDFTNYHHETNGQATLQGHISDEVVAVIDSLLGAKEEYHYLLCHGGVEISYLSEEQRGLRPWLRTADPNNWGRLLEALLVLKPPGGAYQTQTYDHLMTRAEASHLNFAYDHQLSGEDKYIEKLLESDRVCSMAQFTNEQIRA